MTNADFETLGPIGLAVILLVLGTFFFTLYLMGREKRKLMFAISFLVLPLSYLDMALDFTPFSAYRSWSHLPFMVAFTIAMSERLLPSKFDFNKLFKFFMIFTITSMALIPLKVFGLGGVVYVIGIGTSTLCSLIILISVIVQIFKYKDPIVMIVIPAILSLMGGGVLLAMGYGSLFFILHYFAYFLIVPILIYATGKSPDPVRGLKTYFSLNEQLKDAQEDLERSEGKFRMTFNNAKEAIIWMNENGRVVKYNRSARDLFGPLSLNGLDIYSLFVKTEDGPSHSILEKELKEKSTFEGEFVIRIGKRNIPVIITAVNSKFKDETITQFIIFDLSTRKEYERKLKETNMRYMKANKELDQSNQIKIEFISILSHDIINPLVATKAQLELMKEGVFGKISDDQNGAIDGVMKHLDRIQNLRKDTLDIIKLGTKSIEQGVKEVAISEILSHAVKIVEGDPLPSGTKFIISPHPPIRIKCNPQMMERALENLLTNAVRYSEPGSVTRIGALQRGKNIVLYVADQGRGIPQDELQPIFESFYRTGERIDGSTGLGLSIVKGVAEGHGGRAWAESKGPGMGSTFFMELPLDPK